MNQKAKEAAFRMLQRRAHTETEIVQNLKKKSFQEDDIDEVIAFLKECNMIDDGQYARAFIIDQLDAGKGSVYIRNKLREKGVEKHIVEEKMEEFFYDEQEDRNCLIKALRILEIDSFFEVNDEGEVTLISQEEAYFENDYGLSEPDEKMYGRLFRRLAGQGYPTNKIYKTMNKIKGTLRQWT